VVSKRNFNDIGTEAIRPCNERNLVAASVSVSQKCFGFESYGSTEFFRRTRNVKLGFGKTANGPTDSLRRTGEIRSLRAGARTAPLFAFIGRRPLSAS
jgi:hypothetical protein